MVLSKSMGNAPPPKPKFGGGNVTATLVHISVNRKARVAYATAILSTGAKLSGIGLVSRDDPTGKYDALWDLALICSKFDIEVKPLP